ncbi:MAG: PIN domain-containing protein [Acidobacteriota bacterium]
MITSVDTNVLVGLWDRDDSLNSAAQDALDNAVARGRLVICGAVHSELLAFPRRTEAFVDEFLDDTGIAVDWITNEAIWRSAGRALQAYAKRRRKQTSSGPPRRILADFLIGAHAFEKGHTLLTLDQGIYKAAFPLLKIINV